MITSNISSPLAGLAERRYLQAVAGEAGLRNSLNPTHRLFARSNTQPFEPPRALLVASEAPIGARQQVSRNRGRPTGFRHFRPKVDHRGAAGTGTLNPTVQSGRSGQPNHQVATGVGARRLSRAQAMRGGNKYPPTAESAAQHQARLEEVSPEKQRANFLRGKLGKRVGWWANEFVDLIDPVTPALEFLHRREQGAPFDLDDVFLAAGVIPGAGRVFGKVGKLGKRGFEHLSAKPDLEVLRLPSPKTIGSARRKNYIGVASYGDKLPRIRQGEQWLKGSHGNAAKVPLQVAEKLAGREFNNWGHFRKAFWREVGRDPILAAQFDADDIQRMRKGTAPQVAELQVLGKRKTLNIDHHEDLQFNGNMYDMNNLIIRTPLNHVKGK